MKKVIKGIKAVVEKLVPDGSHGPYVIASTKALDGSVTFSLENNVWQERVHPEPGEVVFLYELRKKRLGWRAKKGRYWKPSDEQTANEEEAMKRIMTLLLRLKHRWFPTEEDATWRKWVDFKSRDTGDLIELLSKDVGDNFKKRALFLLTVPFAEVNPIYWKKEVGQFYQGIDFLDQLPPTLLNYEAELIIQFVTAIKPLHCETPKDHGVCGTSVQIEIPDKYHRALRFYNDCILKFMAILPIELQEKIFPLYSLNDISTFASMDCCSGYTPFRNLLYSDVHESWKRAADEKMRQIIRAELEGKAAPRVEHEKAMFRYSRILQDQLYGKLSYSEEFFAEQMQFMMDHCQPNSHLIDSYHVMDVFNRLKGDSYKELRHRVARYVVLENTLEYISFSVFSDSCRMAADQMLEEFGDDLELSYKLKDLVREAEKRHAENAAYRATQAETEESILAAMKK